MYDIETSKMEDLVDTPGKASNSFYNGNNFSESDTSMYKSILSASLIYMILSYLNSFGNIAMYLVSYMRFFGNDLSVNYGSVSYVFSYAVLIQSLSGFLTTYIEPYLGTRNTTLLGCSITSFSLIASGLCLRSFNSLVFFYSVLAGIASGFTIPLPLDSAVRTNPSKRGYICGSVYFYGGLLTVLLCPLQTFYINNGDIRLGDIVSPSDKEVYYKDNKLLCRIPKLFIFQGLFYFAVMLFCLYFLDFPKDREPSTSLTVEPEIEYETFVTKRSERNSDNATLARSKKNRWHYFFLWFLIYLSWQSIIYLQSYWKIVALLKLDGSDLFVTLIGAAASASHIIGRILWGIIFDLIGWRISWFILLIGTLILTFLSKIIFEHSLTLYAIWVTSVFFIHSGVFSIGPMTAHKFFGPNKFIMSVGFLNTARAASGLTALIYANFRFSNWNDHLPFAISLVCLFSLIIVFFFNPPKKEEATS